MYERITISISVRSFIGRASENHKTLDSGICAQLQKNYVGFSAEQEVSTRGPRFLAIKPVEDFHCYYLGHGRIARVPCTCGTS